MVMGQALQLLMAVSRQPRGEAAYFNGVKRESCLPSCPDRSLLVVALRTRRHKRRGYWRTHVQ
jgi:hypothetical protein